MNKTLLAAALAAVVCAGCRPSDGAHELHILTTGDVHGAWFDSTYVGKGVNSSLISANRCIDSLRTVYGKDCVLLIDAGDCLQGDNAAYYSNYLSKDVLHLFPRIASYMGYDAVVVGNHDMETGPEVYRRVRRELFMRGIPFLAGNVIGENEKPFFREYKVFRRAGLKVLVMGYTNANIKAWLPADKWEGLDFASLVPFVQQRVNAVSARVKPDAVIVAVHSGTGSGDGKVLENQGLDLYNSLEGVDLLICAHDHRPYAVYGGGKALVNSGTKAANIGHATLNVGYSEGREMIRSAASEVIPLDCASADSLMRARFRREWLKVRRFTNAPVGMTMVPIRTRDSYAGRCFYMDFIHKIQLESTGADVSFAAPLTFNGTINAGRLIFNDMFILYPFENTLWTITMTGAEIDAYLEYSYDRWIRTWDGSHVLRISGKPDARTMQKGWSFDNKSYNFDSAAGINYTVDVTAEAGSRVDIVSLRDGRAFRTDSTYTVAITSYRASGGGKMLSEGAGIGDGVVESRVVAKYPEIRDLIYNHIREVDTITPLFIGNIGDWRFVPEETASKAIGSDMELLFGSQL